ncbi:MAG TPA: hypothetical protein VGO00_28355 [Kofleriaceae bacterium]|nr:hypothetical protein [Kofleriaceae bacterium]
MIATSLSRIAIIVAIAACGTNKLAGSTSCYSEFTCSSGELCRDQAIGAADDGGTDSGCVDVPIGCDVRDCSGSACPACVMSMCEVPADHATIHGRYLECSF